MTTIVKIEDPLYVTNEFLYPPKDFNAEEIPFYYIVNSDG